MHVQDSNKSRGKALGRIRSFFSGEFSKEILGKTPGSPGEAEAGVAEKLVGDKGEEDVGAFLVAGIAGIQDRNGVGIHTILRKPNNRKNTGLQMTTARISIPDRVAKKVSIKFAA